MLPPCSLTPRVKRTPRVTKVTRSFLQKAREASCSPNGTTFAAAASDRFSPSVQVANLIAEKSNALVSTAKQAMMMTIAPIQIACQSSFAQKSGTAFLFSILIN